ncbi:CvpA family protein [Allofranklinella schreckenbergeri]|uniref:CvpA family protein n=1 Tax=Allofranklinella schreckenbergeri TaxID=1076744 RepID=A0A3M6R5I5_9BURK|nr:CvpA family protein [Allofranklinella schreckenbergeri]RMX10425.1 CvpA family protein [Allofranklinella schreckenbergeri]
MTLNGFDLAFLMLAFLSVAVGIWRGFVFECISLLGWLMGALGAMRLGPELGVMLIFGSISDEARRVLGMLAVFIVLVFLSSMLASMARRSIKALGMRPADRFIGALAGFVRIVLLGVLLAVVIHALRWNDQLWWTSSTTGPLLELARLELAQWLPGWTILQTPQSLQLPSLPPAGAASALPLLPPHR